MVPPLNRRALAGPQQYTSRRGVAAANTTGRTAYHNQFSSYMKEQYAQFACNVCEVDYLVQQSQAWQSCLGKTHRIAARLLIHTAVG